MQLIGSIITAIAIVAVTIAVVTSQLGPFKEDTERQEQIQEQREEQQERQQERREEQQDQDGDNAGGG